MPNPEETWQSKNEPPDLPLSFRAQNTSIVWDYPLSQTAAIFMSLSSLTCKKVITAWFVGYRLSLRTAVRIRELSPDHPAILPVMGTQFCPNYRKSWGPGEGLEYKGGEGQGEGSHLCWLQAFQHGCFKCPLLHAPACNSSLTVP